MCFFGGSATLVLRPNMPASVRCARVAACVVRLTKDARGPVDVLQRPLRVAARPAPQQLLHAAIPQGGHVRHPHRPVQETLLDLVPAGEQNRPK